MPSEEKMETARFNHESPDLKRCDMCERTAMFHNISEHKLSLCSVCHTIVTNSREIESFKTYWLMEFNGLHDTVKNMAHAMQVAIGVRNTKIAELKGKLTTLEKQLKTLTEQVDLNSQTLSELGALDDARSTEDY